MLENCQKYALKLSWNAVFGTHWQTRHSMVSKQTHTSSHQRDQTNAWLVWFLKDTTRVNFSNIVMWETLHHNADWDCFRNLILPEILKTQNRPGSHTFVPISWMKKQSQFRHSSTESEIISLDGRSAHGWNSRSWSLGFGYWSVAFFFQPTWQIQRECAGKPAAWHTIKKNTPRTKLSFQFCTTILNYATSIMFPQTWSLLNLVRCSIFLKIMMRCIPDPQSCIWLVNWENQPGPTKSKSNLLTPKTNSQTYWQRELSHVTNGIIFSICSTSAYSGQQAAPKRCRKECNKEQEKRKLWQSRSRRWTWFRRLRQALLQRRVRVHRNVRGYSEHPVSKVRISLSVQGNLPLEVKCGQQMQSWANVRGNSLL